MRYIYYSYDGVTYNPIDYYFYTVSVGVQVKTEGITTVYFYPVDKAGNKGAVKTQTVKIDKSAPVTIAAPEGTGGVEGWYRSDVTVKLNANDPYSGVSKTKYSYTDRSVLGDALEYAAMTEYDPSNPPVVRTTGVGSDGTKMIYFRSMDNILHIEGQKQYQVKIDTGLPTVNLAETPSTGWYTDSPTFHFTFGDSLSGVYDHSPAVVTQGDTTGTEIVAWATDKAGNRNEMRFTVKVDTTAPTTTLVTSRAANGNNWYNAPVDISFTADDSTSGVDKTFYQLNGGSQQTYTGTPVTINMEGTTVVTYYSVDNAGVAEAEKSYTINIDTGKPTIVVSPTPSASWYTDNPAFHFTFGDSISGIDTNSAADVTVSPDTTGYEVVATATDKAGNTEEMRFTVKVDTTDPAISGAADRAPNALGWYNAPVTVTFTATDATSGVASVNPESTTLSGEGADQSASSTATDNAGNSASTTVDNIDIDLTAPTTSDSLSGTAGSNGWYVGDVTVTLSASDGLSGVKTTEYSTDGTTWAAYTAPVIVSAEGTTTVQYRSTDNADNLESTKSVTFKVDTITPSTTLTPSRPANSRNWYNAPVDISLTAEDATSGVKKTSYRLVVNGVPGSWTTYTPGTSVNISSEGTTVIRYRSTDNAGNIEDVNSYTIRIDTVKPTIAVSPTPSASWYTDYPAFHFTFGDSTSGVLRHSASDVTVSTDSTGYEVVATATDKAGNKEEMRFTVKVDTTNPEISGATDRAPNAQGWYKAPVTVTFAATDATSTVASVNPESTTFSGEGADQSVTGTAIDVAGNTATATVDNIDIDMTVPTTAYRLSGTAGSEGWFTGDVTMTLSASDELSGVRMIEYSRDGETWTHYTDPVAFSAEGTTTVYYRSTDNADNVEGARSVTFNLDKTSPVSSASLAGTVGNNAWYVSDVVVTLTATDDGSAGVKAIEYSTDNGATWTQYTAPVTVSADGTTTVSYRSVDNAGNVETAKQFSFRIDKTLPVLTGKLDGPRSSLGWFEGDARLSVSSSDATSGVSSVLYSLDGATWSPYTGAVTVPMGPSRYVYYGAIDDAGNKKNGTSFAYFPPVSIQYVWSIISPTATPTPTPTPSAEASATPTVTATPEVTATPTVTPAPEPTTTAQTQPGNNWWLYLLGLLVVVLGGAGAYFLFLRK